MSGPISRSGVALCRAVLSRKAPVPYGGTFVVEPEGLNLTRQIHPGRLKSICPPMSRDGARPPGRAGRPRLLAVRSVTWMAEKSTRWRPIPVVAITCTRHHPAPSQTRRSHDPKGLGGDLPEPESVGDIVLARMVSPSWIPTLV